MHKCILEVLRFVLCPGMQGGSSRPRTGASGPKAGFAHKCNYSNTSNQDVSVVDPQHKKSWYKICNLEALLKPSPFKEVILGKKCGPSP